ncbi:conserved hypothetical protein, partial [Ricinus communis]
MIDEDPLLVKLEKSFLEQLLITARTQLEKGEKGFDQVEAEIMESVTTAMHDLLPDQILHSLLSKAPSMLREHRAADRGFERRNFKRWRSAFDAIETMVQIAQEVGEACDVEGRELAMAESDYRFEALSQLFPRAILVAREIIHLLKGGFPDGALSRWRSLHELTVTAMFIRENDKAIALRYLATFDFQARRAAKQYNLYAERANLKPFSAEELADMDGRCEMASSMIGGEIKGDWGWAAPAFSRENATFVDLEKAVKMDHWRPRYKWASQHVHSGHRPGDSLLGASEAKQPIMLVGRSNSGFIDPLHMTAISLSQIAVT